MTYKMVFSEEVPVDLQQNIDWYNQKQPGLGNRFYQTVKSQFSRIKKAPYSTAIRYENVRCTTVKGFPFLVHFTVESETTTIKVIAVFSTHRDPEMIKARRVTT